MKLFRTLSGIPVDELLKEIVAGIAAGGGVRPYRPPEAHRRHLVPRPLGGAAVGSKVGIGIQAKGTAVIHHADRLPHNNLELFSNAPITKLDALSRARLQRVAPRDGELPEPVVVPNHGEAMGSRYHARVALIYAIETSLTVDGASPEEIAATFAEVAA